MRNVVENLRTNIMGKKSSVKLLSVKLDSDLNGNITEEFNGERMYQNKVLPWVKVSASAKVATSNGVLVLKNEFTTDLMMIRFHGNTINPLDFINGFVVIGTDIYVPKNVQISNAMDTGVYNVYSMAYVNIADDRDIVSEKTMNHNLAMNWAKKYFAFCASASMVRKNQVLCINANRVKDADELGRLLTYGSRIFGKMKLPKAQKQIARDGMGTTPVTELKCNDLHISVVSDLDLSNKGRLDGYGIIDADMFAGLCGKQVNSNIKIESGSGIQMRIATQIKGILIAQKESFITSVMSQYKPVQNATLSLDIPDNEVWHINHDGTRVDILVDLNNLKRSFDVNMLGSIDLMDIRLPLDANLSWQAVQKIAAVGEEGIVLLKDLVRSKMAEFIDKTLNGDYKMPSLHESKDTSYFDGILLKMAHDFIKEADRPVYMRHLNMAAKAMTKAAFNCHLPVEGRYLTAIGDVAAMFGESLLNEDEVFAPAMNTEIGYALKYPTIGIREAHRCKLISRLEMVKRADALDNKFAGRAIHEFVASMSPAMIMMPASVRLMHKIAGYDFDGDQILLITEKTIVDFMDKHYKDITVSVTAPEGSDQEVDIKDWSDYGKLILKNFSQSVTNYDVGQMTNIDRIAVAVYIAAQTGDMKAVDLYFQHPRLHFGDIAYRTNINEDGSVDSGIALQEKILMAAEAGIKKDRTSILSFLFDLNVLDRYLQESIIDSAKTGLIPEIMTDYSRVDGRKILNVESLLERHIEIVDGVAILSDRKPIKGCQYIHDWATEVQDIMFEMAAEALNAELESIPERIDANIVRKLVPAVIMSDKYKVMRNFVRTVKFWFGDIVSFRRTCEDTIENRDLSKLLINSLSDFLRSVLANATDSNGEKIFKSEVQYAAFAKAVSMLTAGDKINPNNQNTMVATLLGHEYTKYILREFGEFDNNLPVAGTPVSYMSKGVKPEDGEIVSFTNGKSESGIFLSELVSGDFEMKVIDGRWYATMHISDAIKTPEFHDTAVIKISCGLLNKFGAQTVMEAIPEEFMINGFTVCDIDGNPVSIQGKNITLADTMPQITGRVINLKRAVHFDVSFTRNDGEYEIEETKTVAYLLGQFANSDVNGDLEDDEPIVVEDDENFVL